MRITFPPYVIAFVITVLLIVLILVVTGNTAASQLSCDACSSEHCAKVTSFPWMFNVEAWGQNESYINRVEIKAGGACHVFTHHGSDGCYAVGGIGQKIASAANVGGCAPIEHVLFYWWADHLGTMTPTNVPTLTNTPSATNTPPPDVTPEPTPTLPTRWTPTPTAPATPTKPVVTLTTPPTPIITPTPAVTPTPTPRPKSGTMRGFLFCVYPDGSEGPGWGSLSIETDNIGVVGGIPWPDGYVGTWYTAQDIGTTVLSAGPGKCFRGGDDYPADATEYDLEAQPIFGAGNVGNSAVVCRVPCVDTSTFYLPESGGVRTRSNRR